ncbi:unnamed protein product [Soboliphyme baturini]|uniref:Ion_trans_2 domain-containing protein n=1 Tax=Soboliphyme baturini TaxID=241478 RepID=A0A183IW69_9BILA|nr:unnamed protein product [Soboliphyme baturini]
MLFCAGLFCIWEDWNYFTSFYFFFVSLSTIGLGDVLPSHPKLLVLNFGFVIIGLSLVSMTINVIEKNIERFIFRMKKRMVEEYLAAAAASLTCDKDQLIKKCWSKQPWLTRFFMPRLLTDSKVKQLDRSASNTVKDVSKAAEALGLVQLIHDLDKKHSTFQNGIVKNGCLNPVNDEKKEAIQIIGGNIEKELEPISEEKTLNETMSACSTQTIQQQCSMAVQTCLHTNELSVQTECSYLRKAKILNDLISRRTDSLEVVAASVTRPGKKPRKSLFS